MGSTVGWSWRPQTKPTVLLTVPGLAHIFADWRKPRVIEPRLGYPLPAKPPSEASATPDYCTHDSAPPHGAADEPLINATARGEGASDGASQLGKGPRALRPSDIPGIRQPPTREQWDEIKSEIRQLWPGATQAQIVKFLRQEGYHVTVRALKRRFHEWAQTDRTWKKYKTRAGTDMKYASSNDDDSPPASGVTIIVPPRLMHCGNDRLLLLVMHHTVKIHAGCVGCIANSFWQGPPRGYDTPLPIDSAVSAFETAHRERAKLTEMLQPVIQGDTYLSVPVIWTRMLGHLQANEIVPAKVLLAKTIIAARDRTSALIVDFGEVAAALLFLLMTDPRLAEHAMRQAQRKAIDDVAHHHHDQGPSNSISPAAHVHYGRLSSGDDTRVLIDECWAHIRMLKAFAETTQGRTADVTLNIMGQQLSLLRSLTNPPT